MTTPQPPQPPLYLRRLKTQDTQLEQLLVETASGLGQRIEVIFTAAVQYYDAANVVAHQQRAKSEMRGLQEPELSETLARATEAQEQARRALEVARDCAKLTTAYDQWPVNPSTLRPVNFRVGEALSALAGRRHDISHASVRMRRFVQAELAGNGLRGQGALFFGAFTRDMVSDAARLFNLTELPNDPTFLKDITHNTYVWADFTGVLKILDARPKRARAATHVTDLIRSELLKPAAMIEAPTPDITQVGDDKKLVNSEGLIVDPPVSAKQLSNDLIAVVQDMAAIIECDLDQLVGTQTARVFSGFDPETASLHDRLVLGHAVRATLLDAQAEGWLNAVDTDWLPLQFEEALIASCRAANVAMPGIPSDGSDTDTPQSPFALRAVAQRTQPLVADDTPADTEALQEESQPNEDTFEAELLNTMDDADAASADGQNRALALANRVIVDLLVASNTAAITSLSDDIRQRLAQHIYLHGLCDRIVHVRRRVRAEIANRIGDTRADVDRQLEFFDETEAAVETLMALEQARVWNESGIELRRRAIETRHGIGILDQLDDLERGLQTTFTPRHLLAAAQLGEGLDRMGPQNASSLGRILLDTCRGNMDQELGPAGIHRILSAPGWIDGDISDLRMHTRAVMTLDQIAEWWPAARAMDIFGIHGDRPPDITDVLIATTRAELDRLITPGYAKSLRIGERTVLLHSSSSQGPTTPLPQLMIDAAAMSHDQIAPETRKAFERGVYYAAARYAAVTNVMPGQPGGPCATELQALTNGEAVAFTGGLLYLQARADEFVKNTDSARSAAIREVLEYEASVAAMRSGTTPEPWMSRVQDPGSLRYACALYVHDHRDSDVDDRRVLHTETRFVFATHDAMQDWIRVPNAHGAERDELYGADYISGLLLNGREENGNASQQANVLRRELDAALVAVAGDNYRAKVITDAHIALLLDLADTHDEDETPAFPHLLDALQTIAEMHPDARLPVPPRDEEHPPRPIRVASWRPAPRPATTNDLQAGSTESRQLVQPGVRPHPDNDPPGVHSESTQPVKDPAGSGASRTVTEREQQAGTRASSGRGPKQTGPAEGPAATIKGGTASPSTTQAVQNTPATGRRRRALVMRQADGVPSVPGHEETAVDHRRGPGAGGSKPPGPSRLPGGGVPPASPASLPSRRAVPGSRCR